MAYHQNQIESISSQAKQLQLEAANLGYKVLLSEKDCAAVKNFEIFQPSRLSIDQARALVNNPEGADRLLVLGGVTYHVHTALLTARSSYFTTLLVGGFAEQGQHTVTLDLPSNDPEAFKIVLEYLYTGVVPTTAHETEWVIHVACIASYVDAANSLDFHCTISTATRVN
jgi:BTB/POZ domain